VEDPLVLPLAEALCDLIRFVETRPASADEDDDVKALEGAAFVLLQAPAESLSRLAELLGPEVSDWMGITDRLAHPSV
jgi:hypothetical protein